MVGPSERSVWSSMRLVNVMFVIWFRQGDTTESGIVREVSESSNLLDLHAGVDVFVRVGLAEILFEI